MRMKKRGWQNAVKVLWISTGAITFACVDNSSKDDSAASTGQLAIATDFTDMGLSTALSTDVPAAMKGLGEEATPAAGTIAISLPGLRKMERQRAIEGCEIRRSVKNGLNIIREMAQEICYIEAGAKSFKPNGKYIAKYNEEGWQGDYSVWIDDTVKNRRRVSFCSNGELSYIFDLEAANGGKAKGVVTRINIDPEAAEGETWTVQADFDSGVTQLGRTMMDIRGAYATSYGSSRERLYIRFDEKGLALVAESKVGETPLEDGSKELWTSQSAALMALNLGSVVNKYSFTTDVSEEPAEKGGYRAYFDGKGYALAAADSEAWQPGGPLYVEHKLLPRLPDWTKIELPTDAWDCSGTTEVIPEGTAADYAKCDALKVDWEEENCEDESIFTYTGDAEEISDDAVAPNDKIE
ncbi:MAG TPA: hypothetical protein VE954_05055 [Oligoflexus sp.]|uniref:hypothetical protein n=1 Tax=Oligoflexus sp. TaxID=1971216 RepID=UPI002D4EFF81|nr:hypothetical protein [Oligoflexus sp.]HYX32460.1 hypothetical protein [Oligoflexus sp.]